MGRILTGMKESYITVPSSVCDAPADFAQVTASLCAPSPFCKTKSPLFLHPFFSLTRQEQPALREQAAETTAGWWGGKLSSLLGPHGAIVRDINNRSSSSAEELLVTISTQF